MGETEGKSTGGEPRAGSPFARWSSRLVAASAMSLFMIWTVGQIMRDRSVVTALMFYLPSPVVALALLVTVGVFAIQRRAGGVRCFGFLLVIPVCSVVAIENQWSRPEVIAGEATHRVVHWNVDSVYSGWDTAAEELRALNADLYLLTEVPSGLTPESVRATFDDRYWGFRFGRLYAIARSEIGGREWLYRADGLTVGRLTWKMNERTVQIFFVDIVSDPLVARDPLLRALVQLIREHQPDLIVGDFNAPRRSWMLDGLPVGWSHGYDRAGAGWSYTWPTPVPVFAIDQCVIRDTLGLVEYRLESSSASAHRRQVLELSAPE